MACWPYALLCLNNLSNFFINIQSKQKRSPDFREAIFIGCQLPVTRGIQVEAAGAGPECVQHSAKKMATV